MSQQKQFEEVRNMITDWKNKIQTSPLSSEDKIYAYKTILEKKLLYVLPTCSFTYKQCAELDGILSPALFNAHKIQRNCNRNVLYSSKDFGRLDIYSIYHLQGLSKMQFFFMHYKIDDTTGKLFKTSLRYSQLESGLSKPFYTQNFYKNHILTTPTWLTNLWQYCSESHIQLRQSQPWIYQTPRHNDFFLMDVVMRSDISQQDKEIFNRMRINMRLLTAADIVLPIHGTKIDPDILVGRCTRESNLNWPKKWNYRKSGMKCLEIFCLMLSNHN